MSRFGQSVGLALALVWIGGCARTTVNSTWVNPTAETQGLRGKRVAAFVLIDDDGRRRTAEDTLARELAEKGVRSYPGYQLTKSEPSADLFFLRDKLGEQQVEGAVVMRVIERARQYRYTPGYLIGGPGFISQYTYSDWGTWTLVYNSGYPVTTDIVWVETLVYSITDGKLLWRSVTRTLDPLRVSTVIKSLTDNAANEMKKAGLM